AERIHILPLTLSHDLDHVGLGLGLARDVHVLDFQLFALGGLANSVFSVTDRTLIEKNGLSVSLRPACGGGQEAQRQASCDFRFRHQKLLVHSASRMPALKLFPVTICSR